MRPYSLFIHPFIMKRWYKEFNHVIRESCEKCSKSVVWSENIRTVQKLIIQDSHVI